MLPWIVLLVLTGAEVALLRWWLRRQYYPLFFNGWAAFLYSLVLAGDLLAAWLVSNLYVPGGTTGLSLLTLLGVLLAVVVGLGTLFFRWVVRLEMTDIAEHEGQKKS